MKLTNLVQIVERVSIVLTLQELFGDFAQRLVIWVLCLQSSSLWFLPLDLQLEIPLPGADPDVPWLVHEPLLAIGLGLLTGAGRGGSILFILNRLFTPYISFNLFTNVFDIFQVGQDVGADLHSDLTHREEGYLQVMFPGGKYIFCICFILCEREYISLQLHHYIIIFFNYNYIWLTRQYIVVSKEFLFEWYCYHSLYWGVN